MTTAVTSVRYGVGEAISYNRRINQRHGGRMGLKPYLLTWLLVLPLLAVAGPTTVPVQAATGCEGDIVNTAWNSTVQRHALVPFDRPWQSMWMMEDDGRDKMDEDDGPVSTGANGEWDEALHPEEPWMYTVSGPLTTLRPLEEGHYITMEVGNDSVGALRLNLSSAHRTTFCVSLFSIDNGEQVAANGDIYLMTSSQYTRYEEAYWMMHGGWWWDDIDVAGGDSDVLSDIPPEWRSFNPLGWQTYRDVHQYESRSQATFSLSLDGPEVYSSFFGEDEWEDFYLVIDTWDNTRDDDAQPLSRVVVADVTILTEERTAIFPPWTVPLMLFGLIVGIVLAPVLLNKRYMESGLGSQAMEVTASVPHLEQAPVEVATEGPDD